MSETESDTLYHYCPPEAFYSIISNKTVRLSMLSLSNDSEEGRYLLKAFEAAFAEYGIESRIAGLLLEFLAGVQDGYLGVGFCLSSEPDRLSQWRGYARECTGFSIGFDKSALRKIAHEINNSFYQTAMFDKVIYDRNGHRVIAAEDAALIKEYLLDNPLKSDSNKIDDRIGEFVKIDLAAKSSSLIMRVIYSATKRMYFLKNPSFFEENEWRICSIVSSSMLGRLSFRISGDMLVPYEDCSFGDLGGVVIKSIYVGSRNRTPTDVIEAFLRKYDFENVNIFSSEASFR